VIVVHSAGEDGPIIIGRSADLLSFPYVARGEPLYMIAKISSDDLDGIKERLSQYPRMSARVYHQSQRVSLGNLYIPLHALFQLVRPSMPSSPRGSDGAPRRFTEVVPNEQSLPVAGMKLSRSQRLQRGPKTWAHAQRGGQPSRRAGTRALLAP